MIPRGAMQNIKNPAAKLRHKMAQKGAKGPSFLRLFVSSRVCWVCLLFAVTLLCGCGRPGVRELLDGKKLLEQGHYVQAVEKLRMATTLLATNAQAFNYLGLAC